jgi:uncharacterized repeat protein (TIGR01451 family)
MKKSVTITTILMTLLLFLSSSATTFTASANPQIGEAKSGAIFNRSSSNDYMQLFSNNIETITSTGWYDPDWGFRVPVVISCPCDEDKSEYQVLLSLDSSFNFANAQNDGSDLIITSLDGVTPIPFWIETWDSNAQTASVWVRLPALPLSGTTIYIYYGNTNPPAPPMVPVGPIGPWDKPANNPIVPIGDPGGGASLLAENIVYDSVGDRYWMVFANYRSASVGLVWSNDPGDPDAWNWHGDVIGSGNAPHIMELNGTWYIFYADRAHGGPPYPISVATASSPGGPYTWQSIVLSPSEPWEAYRVDEPYVFQRNDGKWIMVYMADSGGTTEQVGYAEADDIMGPYTKFPGNPALAFGSPGTFDAGTIADPWVVELDGTYYIGYTVSPSKSSPWQTAYATTTDWQTFTKKGMILPLGLPGTWDSYNSFRGAVTRFGDTYYFAYTGDSYRMGIATMPVYRPVNSPDLVFDFYDPFDGDELSTRWYVRHTTGTGHTIVVANGSMTVTASPGTGSGFLEMWGNPLVGTESLYEVYASHPDAGLNPGSETNTAAEVGYKTYDFNNLIRMMDYPDLTYYTIQTTKNGVTSNYVDTQMPWDTDWHTYTISRTLDGKAGFQIDDYNPQYIQQPYVPTMDLQPWFMNYARLPAPQSRLVVDWVRLRQWCGAAPEVQFGSQEIAVDLALTKTDSEDPLYAGETLTYTLTITNYGSFTSTQVSITDTLPQEVSLISAIPDQGTCDPGDPLTCNLGDIPGGENVQVIIAVDTLQGGEITNTATVIPDPNEADTSNNTDTETTTIIAADLGVTSSDSPDPVTSGLYLTYTVNIHNFGPSDASGVTFTDTLPVEASLVSIQPSQGDCTGIVCDLGSITAGEDATVAILTSIDPWGTGTITNTAEVSSNEPDLFDENNTSYEVTTLDVQADLSLTKSSHPKPVIAGDLLTYTLTIFNNGPSGAVNVIVTDVLPEYVYFVSAVPGTPICTESDSIVTCNLYDMAPNSTREVIITVEVDPTTHWTLVNQATLTADTYDPDSSDNSAEESTPVDTAADLTIKIIDEPDPTIPGGDLTYTLVVTNNGPSNAINMSVVDYLPLGINYRNASPNCVKAQTKVTCYLGNVLRGDSTEATIVLGVNNTTIDTLVNQALVSSYTTDPDEDNNQAVEMTSVDPDHPTVTWVLPVGDDQVYYTGPGSMTLAVTATDNIAVDYVTFAWWDENLQENVTICQVNSEPYQCSFDTSTLQIGWNQLFAQSFDTAGNGSHNPRINVYLYYERYYMPLVTR